MDVLDDKKDDATLPEMTFWDHLGEFRIRVIKSLISIVIITVVAFFYSDFIVNKIVLFPAKKAGLEIINLKPFGQVLFFFEVSFWTGLILSIPVIIYQFWAFVKPALYEKERKIALNIILSAAFLSILGVLFIYFIFLPVSLNFVVNFGSVDIKNQINLDEYTSLLISLFVGSVIIFELPIISFILSYAGLLKPMFLKKFRKHSIVTIFILSAILSPGTDPISQILLAVPFLIIYEISIIVSNIVMKIKYKEA